MKLFDKAISHIKPQYYCYCPLASWKVSLILFVIVLFFLVIFLKPLHRPPCGILTGVWALCGLPVAPHSTLI